MKKNILMASALMCALAAATTGCNNDELNENTSAGGQFTITASTPNNGANTRVDYDETDATKVKLTWNANDAIGVWKAGETTVNAFTAAADGASADFTGSATFVDGDQLYAVYPKPSAVSNNAVTLDLSTAQSGTLSDSYQYMYASASAKDNTASFNFEHAVSVLKLTLKGDFTSPLTTITLKGTNLNNKATLSMSAAPTVTGSQAGNITATGSFAKDATVYLYLFPGSPTGLTLEGTDGTKTYEATLADKNVVAGKVYTAEVTMTAKAADDFVVVGNLKWAVGNLVADGEHGAKIGTATDGGLYFRFGSLIGWSGGANGDGTSTAVNSVAAVKVKPANFNGTEAWADKGNFWQATVGTVPFTAAGSNDEKAGIGDPCRYYLGDTWRLPTKEEYGALFKDGGYPNGTWKWENSSATNGTLNLTFPASGYRYGNGVLGSIGTMGYCWSASPGSSASLGYSLFFLEKSAVQASGDSRSSGMPVRCVRN